MDSNKFKLFHYKKQQIQSNDENMYEDDSSNDTSEEEKEEKEEIRKNNKLIFLKWVVNDYEIDFLLDTSLTVSFIPQYIAELCNLSNNISNNLSNNLNIMNTMCPFIISTTIDIPIIGLDNMIRLGMTINFHTKEITFVNKDYLFDFK